MNMPEGPFSEEDPVDPVQQAYWDMFRAAGEVSPGIMPLAEAERLAERTAGTRHLREYSLLGPTYSILPQVPRD